MESYLADMEVEELSKHLQVRKRIVVIVGAAAFVVVLLWVGVVGYAYIDYRVKTNGVIVESIEVITEEEYLELNGGIE